MKTNREAEFSQEIFRILRERAVMGGFDSTETLAEAMQVEAHTASGYAASLRENRPWCLGTSLRFAEAMGWDLDIGFLGEAA